MWGKPVMYRRIVTFGLLIALIGGCAGMTDRQQTQAQGAAVGTAGGAAAGAALGAIFGGKDGAIIGASVGAGVGLLAGALYGTHVANQKAKFASEEDYLDAVIASAHQLNNETKQYNISLAEQVNDLDAKTVQLVRQYNQKLVGKKSLEDEQRVIVAKLSEMEAQLKKVKSELNSQSKVLNQVQDQSSPKVAQWNSEIAELVKNRSALEEQVTRLAAIKTRVSV